jgi:hypothetical protein
MFHQLEDFAEKINLTGSNGPFHSKIVLIEHRQVVLDKLNSVVLHKLRTTASFNLDIHTGWKTQLIQGFDRLGGRLNNVNQTLVGSNLELLSSFFIDMRARKDRITLNSRWQRDRAMHFRAGALHSVDDFRGTLIENRVIVRFHPNPNTFL